MRPDKERRPGVGTEAASDSAGSGVGSSVTEAEAPAHPVRIQRKRTRGWRMPKGAVYVGRPTKWGNPHKVSAELPAAEAVRRYRVSVLVCLLPFTVDDVVRELAGRDLACWCPLDQPCHADALLELAAGAPVTAGIVPGGAR